MKNNFSKVNFCVVNKTLFFINVLFNYKRE